MNHVPELQYGYEFGGRTEAQLRLLCGPCDIERDDYLARFCGSCSAHCKSAYVDKPNSWGLVTPSHPLIKDLLCRVGGLSFSVPGVACDIDRLQSEIDLVTADRRSIEQGRTLYAVSPTVLFRRRATPSGVTWSACHDIRNRLGLDPSARLLLTGNARDDLLQWWWENQAAALEAVRANRFEWVLSPNYSIYGDRCPVEWAYNLKRSLVCYCLLKGAGPNTVPTLMLPNSFFEKRVEAWLRENPQANCIAVNLQMMRDAEFWAALNAVSHLDQTLGHRVHFIVTGPTKQERVARIRKQLAHATIVSSFTLNGPLAYGPFARQLH